MRKTGTYGIQSRRNESYAGLLELVSGAAWPSEGVSGSSLILAASGGTLEEPDVEGG